jgi:hypothetical protein
MLYNKLSVLLMIDTFTLVYYLRHRLGALIRFYVITISKNSVSCFLNGFLYSYLPGPVHFVLGYLLALQFLTMIS